MKYFPLAALWLGFSLSCMAQNTTLLDDFEGNGSITTWFGDDCGMNPALANPFPGGGNASPTVLAYDDMGGQYANIRFDAATPFDMATQRTFSLKIYVPGTGITGNQPNQVSLKLQNGALGEPWTTQSEIIRPIVLDQWQVVTFDFANGNFRNLDPGSPPPIQCTDFNRLVIQVNGENNTDRVVAYIDDLAYSSLQPPTPVFDFLVWSDEFNTDGNIDGTKWFHQTQLPAGGSWYNGEIQHYTNRTANSFVENGILNIRARRENFNDQGHTKSFTSARLNSKFAFQYGRVEVRAKLPSGVGTWPAIWTLGKNITEAGAYWETLGYGTTSWPACGEIDIMEHWGVNPNYVQSAMHTPSSFGNTVNHGGRFLATATSAFHIYTLDWTETEMVFSVDGIVHYTYRPDVRDASTWPFDAEQYLLLNFAIQPNIAPSFNSGTLEVDYVRIYQASPLSSVDDLASPTPSVYPNPFRDALTIHVGQAAAQVGNVRIFSVDGKLVGTYPAQAHDEQITLRNLSHLAKGVYILRFEVDGQNHAVQVVKD